ncbi:MAG: hypothetical protein CND86_03685 [Bacteroidetes bacterium MED-G21]|nr:MAG: hypothetical protein CND86_03685 [Bacteroidetes bacterium MED-G21]|tara:strand:- start:1 stop:309 length:309 start_codon:yes stop_codon:yes gene_type:complete
MNSCEVEHFYEAEITVVNDQGEPMPDFTVETTVEVDADYEPYREGVTNDMGKVSFSYYNVAILKVKACLICDPTTDNEDEIYGEALIVLEEDKIVPITVVVY